MSYKDPSDQRAAQRRSYSRNKDTISSREKLRRIAWKEWYQEFMAGKSCTFCSESALECLDWHHIDPSTKTAQISYMVRAHRSKTKILEEMDKCVLVCSNCHRKIHANTLVIPAESQR